MIATTTTCSRCGTEKPRAEFHENPRAKTGYFAVCKSCLLGYSRSRPQSKEGRMKSIISIPPDATAIKELGTCNNVACRASPGVPDSEYELFRYAIPATLAAATSGDLPQKFVGARRGEYWRCGRCTIHAHQQGR